MENLFSLDSLVFPFSLVNRFITVWTNSWSDEMKWPVSSFLLIWDPTGVWLLFAYGRFVFCMRFERFYTRRKEYWMYASDNSQASGTHRVSKIICCLYSHVFFRDVFGCSFETSYKMHKTRFWFGLQALDILQHAFKVLPWKTTGPDVYTKPTRHF